MGRRGTQRSAVQNKSVSTSTQTRPGVSFNVRVGRTI